MRKFSSVSYEYFLIFYFCQALLLVIIFDIFSFSVYILWFILIFQVLPCANQSLSSNFEPIKFFVQINDFYLVSFISFPFCLSPFLLFFSLIFMGRIMRQSRVYFDLLRLLGFCLSVDLLIVSVLLRLSLGSVNSRWVVCWSFCLFVILFVLFRLFCFQGDTWCVNLGFDIDLSNISNVSNFRFGNSGNYAFGFLFGFRVSSFRPVCGFKDILSRRGVGSSSADLHQFNLLGAAQLSFSMALFFCRGSSAVTWHNCNMVLQHEMAPCYSRAKPGGILCN